jgi:hypothetical protein
MITFNKIVLKAKKLIKTIIVVFIKAHINPIRVKNKQKIFCIGRNKTGTTSFARAMMRLGYIVGNQRKAEMLFYEYTDGNFDPIIEYCKTAQVFQDFPFSAANTYKHLDKAFPGSKFVLTVRDSPEQWYNSLINFHSKIFGKGKIPTKQDLQNAVYIWKGRPWQINRLYGTPEDDPYNKDILINNYMQHNLEVMDYFKDRPNDLLVINVGEKDSYSKLMSFLNIDSPYSEFPWENKTTETSIRHERKIQ